MRTVYECECECITIGNTFASASVQALSSARRTDTLHPQLLHRGAGTMSTQWSWFFLAFIAACGTRAIAPDAADVDATACTTNANCPSSAPVCDPARGVCVQCSAQRDCPAGLVCGAGRCAGPVACMTSR